MTKGCQLLTRKFEELTQYQNEEEESRLRLTFEQYIQINVCMSFVIFVYQDRNNISENSLCIYDIEAM